MNLLHVVHYPAFGGPHNRAIRLRSPLAERGWRTVVLLPNEPGSATPRLREAGLDVVTLPLHRLRERIDPRLHLRFMLNFPLEVARIRRLIRQQHIDVVLINGLVNPHAAIAAKLAGTPVVWQLLDTRPPMLVRRVLMPLVTSLADVVMTTGMEVARVHPGSLGLGSRLIPFFPPVDTALFQPDQTRRAQAREELGLAPDDLVIGNVSNVNLQKGHATFIRAAAFLRKSYPNARFVILGAISNNCIVYAEDLWREAASLGMEMGRDLIVRDPGSRVADLAPAFDIFWLTSEPRSEGVPTVIEEAMSLALPVVSVDVGAVQEVVEDGVTGIVVPPLDPPAIARATQQLIKNACLCERMGAEARRRAVERFDVEVCAETHVRAFEAAIAHHNKNARKEVTPVGDHKLTHDGEGQFKPENETVSAASLAAVAKALLACPSCRSALDWGDDALSCGGCGAVYRMVDGIPVLLPPVGNDSHKATQIEYYDEETDPAFEVSRPHGTPRLYQRLLTEKFKRSIESVGSLAQQTVLTVCGGSGMDAEFLARKGAFVIASDISLGAAKRTRERAERFGVSIFPIVADAEHLPFADRSVDLVYVHDGLHHLTDPFTGLREMGRVAKRAISITEPVRAGVTAVAVKLRLAQEVEDAGNRVARLVPDDIARTLQSLGFSRVYRDRYAMYYKHRPGPVMRVLSAPGVFPAAVAGWHAANVVLGRVGNKIAVQGERSIT